MKLLDLLKEVEVDNIVGKTDLNIKEVVFDSNKVVLDSLFICIVGKDFDGHEYVKQAQRAGELYRASEEKKIVPILCQTTPYELHDKIPCMKLSDILPTKKEEPNKTNRTYTCAEVAELCGVSVSTIRKWIRDGLLTATKYANMYVISQEDLLIYAKKFDPNLESQITNG